MLAVLCGISGCGAREETAPTAAVPPKPVDEDLLSLVPTQIAGVLRVDLAQIRTSVIWEAVDILSGDQELGKLKAVIGVDAVERYNEVLIAFDAGHRDRDGEFLVLAKGTFDTEALFKTVLDTPQTRLEEIGGYKVAWAPDYLFVALTHRTFALGTRSMIARVTALASGTGPSIGDDAELGDFSLDESVGARLFYKRALETPDFSQYGVRPTGIPIEAITGLDGVLELNDGLTATLAITTETQLDAAGLERSIRQIQRELGRNMLLVLFGLDWVLDKITSSSDRKTVTLRLVLDQRDLEELKHAAKRISKMRQLTDGKKSEPEGGGGGVGEPGAGPVEGK